MPPLGGRQRRGFDRLCRRKSFPQQRQVDIWHREIEHQHVEARNANSQCGGRRIGRHCRAMPGRPQQSDKLLGASGIAFKDEYVQGTHAEK